MANSEPLPPEILYRNGLALLRNVREAPPFMQYDARAAAFVAPGHRLAELRAWAAERGVADHTVIDAEPSPPSSIRASRAITSKPRSIAGSPPRGEAAWCCRPARARLSWRCWQCTPPVRGPAWSRPRGRW